LAITLLPITFFARKRSETALISFDAEHVIRADARDVLQLAGVGFQHALKSFELLQSVLGGFLAILAGMARVSSSSITS